MTLEDVKVLLTENNIPFELVEYKDEKEYWHHTTLFPYTKGAQNCNVLAMVVKSNNGEKDIELQFNKNEDVFYLEELYFGSYCFELFEYQEELGADELIADIREFQEGNLTIIVANNIDKKFWLWNWCYDLKDTDDKICGKSAFEEEMLRIQAPQTVPKGLFGKLWARLFHSKIQYEIYDWNTYHCIVK